jgi:hypothetical protein
MAGMGYQGAVSKFGRYWPGSTHSYHSLPSMAIPALAPFRTLRDTGSGLAHGPAAEPGDIVGYRGLSRLQPDGCWLWQSVEKGFCGHEVGCVEPFGEPVVDRLKERHRISEPALTAQ